MNKFSFPSRVPGVVSEALHALVSQIPGSTESPAADPAARAQSLAKSAALKAAAISGSFTLPAGPLGMATVLPDLLAVWRIQQQLVADIAAAFGRTDALNRETMIIALFKHGGAAITHRLFAREGENIVVQRIANRTLHQLLEKIAVRPTQRLAAKSVSRWLPILGALGAGAYAYYDTTHVATNAIELFSRKIRLELESGAEEIPAETRSSETKPKPARARTRARTKPRGKPAKTSTRSPAKKNKTARG